MSRPRYSELKAAARRRLGDLFDENDYPVGCLQFDQLQSSRIEKFISRKVKALCQNLPKQRLPRLLVRKCRSPVPIPGGAPGGILAQIGQTLRE